MCIVWGNREYFSRWHLNRESLINFIQVFLFNYLPNNNNNNNNFKFVFPNALLKSRHYKILLQMFYTCGLITIHYWLFLIYYIFYDNFLWLHCVSLYAILLFNFNLNVIMVYMILVRYKSIIIINQPGS